jgi:hypothetical protein
MTRGVGYGPVGVVPGVFMMSQEYRPSMAIRGIGWLNVPRGTFSGSGKRSVVNVPRGTLPLGPPEWVPRHLRQKGQFLATGQGTQGVVRRPQ